jgi:hypothetical protein
MRLDVQSNVTPFTRRTIIDLNVNGLNGSSCESARDESEIELHPGIYWLSIYVAADMCNFCCNGELPMPS